MDLVLVPTQSDRPSLYAGRCRNRNLLKFTKKRHQWIVISHDHKVTFLDLLVEFLQCKHYCGSLLVELRIISFCSELSVLDANPPGRSVPSSKMCESTAPSPQFDASHCSSIGLSGSYSAPTLPLTGVPSLFGNSAVVAVPATTSVPCIVI